MSEARPFPMFGVPIERIEGTPFGGQNHGCADVGVGGGVKNQL